MRLWIWIGLLAAGCSAAPEPEGPEDPEALAGLLRSPDPLSREEAMVRLGRLGRLADGGAEDTGRMAVRVRDALRERDPERMVFLAWHSLRLGLLSREWAEVSTALARMPFRLTEIYEPHDRVKYVRFMARPGAFVDFAETPYDLFFWVETSRMGDGRWAVREVYVGLHGTVDLPFKAVAQGSRYREGSVLAQFLDLPEAKRLSAIFPVLEEIELTYGRIRTKEGTAVPAGFQVNAGLALGPGGKAGGRGIVATAESGLDPRETPGGRLLREGFSPQATLGPLVVRGTSFWGAGGLKPSDD
jgi:hypothetical protein